MTFHGKYEKTNFSPHFLAKTSKLRHDIPENVVKITTFFTDNFWQRDLS